MNAVELINQRKKNDKDSIVIMIINANSSDCYSEDGTAISADPSEFSFWMEVFKQRISTQSLRIKHSDLDGLSGYIIRECNYSKLIDAWEF